MGEAMPLFTEGVRRKTARTIRYHVQYSTKRRNLQGILQRFFSFFGTKCRKWEECGVLS
jgi:hypothetical protein